MGPRSDKLFFNSVLNFRRVTHFGLCLLETQVQWDWVSHNSLEGDWVVPDLVVQRLYKVFQIDDDIENL